MGKRSLFVVCVLTILTLLLTATAAFAQEEDPERVNPVIVFLSGLTGMAPGEIAAQKESGYSLGNVARAYLFAELTGSDPSEAMGQSHGRGWGVMFRAAGLDPGGGGRGLGWMIGGSHEKPDRPDKPDHGHGHSDHEVARPPWAGGPPPWAGGEEEEEPPD